MLVFAGLGNSQTPEPFPDLSKKMKFTFKLPAGFEKISNPAQSDVMIHYSFKKDDNCEYRIAAYPLYTLPSNIPSIKKEDELNKLLTAMLSSMCQDVSHDENLKPDIRVFDKKEVRAEFDGDAGLHVTVPGNSEFSKGYAHVRMNCIYREGRGIIVVYILIKDMDLYLANAVNLEYKNAYYCIRFNK